MHYLTRDDVKALTPWVWKLWKPGKYKGEVWWKFEDVVDLSFIFADPNKQHSLTTNFDYILQFIPFGKLSIKSPGVRGLGEGSGIDSRGRTPEVKATGIYNMSTASQINMSANVWKRKSLRCTCLAPCKSKAAFVAVDNEDHLYFFDLASQEIWMVMNCPIVCALAFCHDSESEVLIGKENGRIDKICANTKLNYGSFYEHSFPVKGILFFDDGNCLSYSREEAWIWNIYTFEPLHLLTFHETNPVNVMSIHPSSQDILCFFSDTLIQLWRRSGDNIEPPRLIHSYIAREFTMEDGITCVDFFLGNYLMAIGGNHKIIALVNTQPGLWNLKRVLQLPQSANATKSLKFLEIPNYHSNSEGKKSLCLAVLTQPFNEFLIYDLDNVRMKDEHGKPICYLIDVESEPSSFDLIQTEEGYALFRTEDGFVDVYTTFWWLNENFCPWLHFERSLGPAAVRPRRGLFPELKERGLALPSASVPGMVDQRSLYTEALLHAPGRQFPPGERKNYWKLGLVIPGNTSAFLSLANSSFHPYALQLIQDFNRLPYENLILLIKTTSAFYYYSPAFYVLEDFPKLVYHFLKFLNWSPHSTFEILLTILNNFCTDWLIDFPSPPKKILSYLEATLEIFDERLAKRMKEREIPLKCVFWKMLVSLFSRVLDQPKWAVLWDHIICTNQSFIIMVPVAIVVLNRNIFLRYYKRDDITNFEDDIRKAGTNVASVILITKYLLKRFKMEREFHFRPLSKGTEYSQLYLIFDDRLVKNEIEKRSYRKIIHGIEFQEHLHDLRLLDPRPRLDALRGAFINEHYGGHQQSELSEEDLEIYTERITRFKYLIKLLKHRPLQWIKGEKSRTRDHQRLKLLEKLCPIEEESMPLPPPQKRARSVPKFKLVTQVIFPRPSPRQTFKGRKSVRSDPPSNMYMEDCRSLEDLKLLLGAESETDLLEDGEEEEQSADQQSGTPSRIYNRFFSTARRELRKLGAETELVKKRLDCIRSRLRAAYEAEMAADFGTESWRIAPSREIPARRPDGDWRKKRRDEILAVIEELRRTLTY